MTQAIRPPTTEPPVREPGRVPLAKRTACTAKPCENCPWRKTNHGRRHPGGFFTKANRQRLWNQIRGGGGIQSCHMTDPSHPDHVAHGTPEHATAMECCGSVVLVVRELNRLKELSRPTATQPDEITRAGCDAYLAETRDRRGLKRDGLLYYMLARQADPPVGDGILPKPPDDLVDADWIGR